MFAAFKTEAMIHSRGTGTFVPPAEASREAAGKPPRNLLTVSRSLPSPSFNGVGNRHSRAAHNRTTGRRARGDNRPAREETEGRSSTFGALRSRHVLSSPRRTQRAHGLPLLQHVLATRQFVHALFTLTLLCFLMGRSMGVVDDIAVLGVGRADGAEGRNEEPERRERGRGLFESVWLKVSEKLDCVDLR